MAMAQMLVHAAAPVPPRRAGAQGLALTSLAAPCATCANGHGAGRRQGPCAESAARHAPSWLINLAPMLANTCYSFVDRFKVIHVASVRTDVAAEKTFCAVPGAGGLSTALNPLEGVYALDWANNIWADTLA